jgi:Fe-S cluster assembly protein SufD
MLEIYADDVKCSHGATAGSLNEDELFYMRSRGIPESEAKVLQLISFLSPVLASLPDSDALAAELEAAIRSIVQR